jgi:hypothetical protein
MKFLFSILFSLVAITAMAQQTYNPTKGTASNKPYAPSQGVPTDSRTYFYDSINFVWRPYLNTTEVKSYLNLSKYRVGQFDIVVNTGGTLNSGVITGGTNALWYFKNGTADSNLILKSNSIDTTTRYTGLVTQYGRYVDSLFTNDNYVKLQLQNPLATLVSNITSYQRKPAGADLTILLAWGAGRLGATSTLKATDSLSTIIVGGVSQSFSQPNVGSSVTGVQSVTAARNTTVVFNNIVTTITSKSATASATVTFYDKRYIGWATTSTPSDAEILAAINQDNNGGTVAYSTTLAQLGSARYLFYANTAQCTSVTVNGFPSTSAFTLNVSRSLTNSDGGVTTYYVTTSNNAIGATSTTALTVN